MPEKRLAVLVGASRENSEFLERTATLSNCKNFIFNMLSYPHEELYV